MKIKKYLLFLMVALFFSSINIQADSPKTISGRVEMADSIAPKAKPDGVLFVYIRNLGNDAGPPIAVVKIEHPTYPQSFTIKPEDTMSPKMNIGTLSGKYVLYARHSNTGKAMTKEGFIGKFSNDEKGITAGSKSYTVTIDSDYK